MAEAYGGAGLSINARKTEVMQQKSVQNHTQNLFYVGETTLANVNTFTYLGSVLNNTHDLTQDVQRRISLASAAFGRLSHRVFLNHNLNHLGKSCCIQSSVRVNTSLWMWSMGSLLPPR